jgi:uncharacterized repeat protein (TIGR03803 family)
MIKKTNLLNTACVVSFFCVTTVVSLCGQTLTTLHSFENTDGANPYAGLVQAINGNLYGTTAFGGTYGLGTLFEITPSGTQKTLYNFCSQGAALCTDGAYPEADLIQATDGNIYGVAAGGGSGECQYGCGTLFRISLTGTLKTLYTFCSQGGTLCTDGAYPNAVVQGADGNLYGTTNGGGANGVGTVFRMSLNGLKTLYTFDNTSGGGGYAQLVQGADGKFYGTTYQDGANGFGTVFDITPGGTLQPLHNFDGTDGSAAQSLALATSGNFYGTTFLGGSNNLGTLFEMSPAGTFHTLYNFDGTVGSGPNPLIQGSNGSLFGSGSGGGTNGAGTVFEMSLTGKMGTLYNFCSRGGDSCTDGDLPNARLVQHTNGLIYGTTVLGGIGTCQYGCGTVFALSVGLGPFVKTLTASGKAGTKVKILGTNLTGATSVAFNGTSATFSVNSSSLITAVVPAGATTGLVTVTTPQGVLNSNTKFQIR